jgi:hypothetical protein
LCNAVEPEHKGGCWTCELPGLLVSQGSELKLNDAAGRLCAAAFSDGLFELQRLVENGISCNSGDYDGRTALHLAACEG